MSIDLSQFHQVFFEESFEGLDEMESSLMALDPQAIDSETINSIFRAAHSIKGGSATFGFSNVAEFTHVLETLLDEIRDGKRSISQDDVDLFLQSVDCLRDMLTALQSGGAGPAEQADELKRQFEAILAGSPAPASAPIPSSEASSKATEQVVSAVQGEGSGGWLITFKPGADLLRTGNDPVRIFRELAELGTLSVEPQLELLPDFGQLELERCYIDWRLTLIGDIDREQINTVFEWVEDDAEIVIEPLSSAASSTASVAPAESGWHIAFTPGADVFKTGNEPLRLLRELRELGELIVRCNVAHIPEWSTFNPEECYVCWNLTLHGDVQLKQIEEVFEWVADESTLVYEKLGGDNLSPVPSAVAEPAPAVETPLVPAVTQSAGTPSAVAQPVDANPVAVVATEESGDAAGSKSAAKAPAKNPEAGSIRVGIDKIDNLINMVGELVITQSMLGQLGRDFTLRDLPKLMEGLSQLEQNTRELQESVMRIRMLPISFAFSRFPRMVRDLGRRLKKEIHLELLGEQTELDKTVMEKIGDPLVHLVRNAVDHGIELPEDRRRAGKPAQGRIVLNAYHQGGNVVIEIEDDGKGLSRDKILSKAIEKNLVAEKDAAIMSDEQVFDLIFAPGFSTAAQVSDVSGRGVGMDVVRRNILELNGAVEITSKEGKGSRITIRLPLTLAILDGQLVRVGSHTYIFPLISIVESLQLQPKLINRVAGGCDVFQLRNEYVPIIRLFEIFDIIPDNKPLEDSLLVVVECDGEKIGIVVDDLLAQQQVVIKSLEQNYRRVEGVSGATILGDGRVALILDIPGLVKLAGVRQRLSTRISGIGLPSEEAMRKATH